MNKQGVTDVKLNDLNKYDVRAIAGIEGTSFVVVTGVLHVEKDKDNNYSTYVRIINMDKDGTLTEPAILANTESFDQILCGLDTEK